MNALLQIAVGMLVIGAIVKITAKIAYWWGHQEGWEEGYLDGRGKR